MAGLQIPSDVEAGMVKAKGLLGCPDEKNDDLILLNYEFINSGSSIMLIDGRINQAYGKLLTSLPLLLPLPFFAYVSLALSVPLSVSKSPFESRLNCVRR